MPELPYAIDVVIELLLASPVHRYEGRPADGPRDATSREVHDSIQVRAGLGIVGDRYFGHAAHRTASVTLIAAESLDHVTHVLGVPPVDAAAARRNIVLRGAPVDELRGEVFSLDTGSGPVLFRAHRPANPCAWMDVALAPGAHKALLKRGGIRCEPLTSGTLSVGPAVLRTERVLAQPTLL
ncbi:MOSC domain-containing protein YiiM [Microbacteriaceae bacterium SG_E_30_P1]|uniref:MOSC domain-containing protein YiiM n=1 Tax=Antiquaquibacter oligotrophicus TaxID=2880260 RepID=A0ABT6KM59_9MICO|nr:MOSC domain-containing protein [Antiquaquibacter oligotrophicus]MDH6180264.1 MOSC domain-containing protein YiiM [Antiquaquibacter oligotrophicus]UDF13989.1 MOSC domain-containing protein [Antiquaquibacter oligotrophicus]